MRGPAPTPNPLPYLMGAGGLGYGGYQFDNWNREDAARQRRSEDRMIENILKRKRFYDEKGINRNDPYGTMSPPRQFDRATKPQGEIVPGFL